MIFYLTLLSCKSKEAFEDVAKGQGASRLISPEEEALARALANDNHPMAFIQSNSCERLKNYLKNGGNPNEKVGLFTLLAYAVSLNRLECAEILIDNGALLDSRSNGVEILAIAAQSRCPNAVLNLLLSRGAPIKEVSVIDDNALMLLVDIFLNENRLADLLMVYKKSEGHHRVYDALYNHIPNVVLNMLMLILYGIDVCHENSSGETIFSLIDKVKAKIVSREHWSSLLNDDEKKEITKLLDEMYLFLKLITSENKQPYYPVGLKDIKRIIQSNNLPTIAEALAKIESKFIDENLMDRALRLSLSLGRPSSAEAYNLEAFILAAENESDLLEDTDILEGASSSFSFSVEGSTLQEVLELLDNQDTQQTVLDLEQGLAISERRGFSKVSDILQKKLKELRGRKIAAAPADEDIAQAAGPQLTQQELDKLDLD